jgi:predicted 3-demethylubiquinone-9 3-methyltransferase (glyoxalase superfamily)
VVRYRGRGCGTILLLHLQGLSRRQDQPLCRRGPGDPRQGGGLEFEIAGQKFAALNGGPQFKFSEAISFQVHCDDQDEVDYFWEKLTEGGKEVACGWLKDKYGLSWQVVPKVLFEMLSGADQQKAQRVTKAFLQMKKFNIAELQRAYAGAP